MLSEMIDSNCSIFSRILALCGAVEFALLIGEWSGNFFEVIAKELSLNPKWAFAGMT